MNREFSEAVAELEIYARQVPEDAGAYLNLGIALRYDGRLDRAMTELKKVIDMDGDANGNAHYQLARIYRERKEYDAALRYFEIALQRGMKSPKTEAEYEALKKESRRP